MDSRASTEPEELLERMFLIRHELITARTMAAQAHEVYGPDGWLDRSCRTSRRATTLRDLADQFDRVRSSPMASASSCSG